MKTKIAGYVKTEHFLYRQWDRGLSDYQLQKILNRIHSKEINYILVIGNSILRKLGISHPRELFIKVKGKVLITLYYGTLESQMRKNNKENYILL